MHRLRKPKGVQFSVFNGQLTIIEAAKILHSHINPHRAGGRVSVGLERAYAAVRFLQAMMDRHSSAGQPLWPLVLTQLLSSQYDTFLAGELRAYYALVITHVASVYCWG